MVGVLRLTHTQLDEDLLDALDRCMQAAIDTRSLRDIDATVGQVVAAAVRLVPGAAGGSITRPRDGEFVSFAATDDRVSRLDEAQADLQQGPCIDAATTHEGSVLVRDLGGLDADRWPSFAPVGVRLGYPAMLSTGLASRGGGPRSSLNLYGAAPQAFDGWSRTAAAFVAVQAAALLHGADEIRHLDRALASRDVIGQAKGILMERFGVDEDEAFRTLVTTSKQTNMKLAAVARWLVTETATRAGQDTTASRPGSEP